MIRKKATYSQVDYGIGFLHVAVALDDKPGATLVIFTNHQHPNDWATEEIIPVTPALVASWISSAIDLGWQADKKGPQFHVKINTNGQMKPV